MQSNGRRIQASRDDSTERTCLFVASSDNTMDVFRNVFPAFERFWPECPFRKFVGLNSAVDPDAVRGFHPVYAPVRGWREELAEQILRLPERFDYILLFLDDFLILSRVEAERLRRLVDEATRRRLDYLRLVPVRRAALPRFAKTLFVGAGDGIEPIPDHCPYYSSLQLALWKRRHLAEILKRDARNIWEFEHQRIDGAPHFAVTCDPPIRYLHVVEKGRWQPYARRMFRRLGLAFDPAHRAVLGRRATLTIWVNRVKFEILGYGVLRLKRIIRGPVR